MEAVVGVVLALFVSLFARLAGFDRDRAFYPTLLVVIALYYVLFAVMGGSVHALLAESVVMMGFSFVAVVGFKRNLWLVVGALAGHGVFDLVHGSLVTNPGVPAWWPLWCLAYDVTAAGFLAWLLTRGMPADTSREIGPLGVAEITDESPRREEAALHQPKGIGERDPWRQQ